MPTLPLYTAAAPPDASHQSRAPGSYEHWSFSATTPHPHSTFTLTFAHGDPLSTDYFRTYTRYRRRPTRVAPPVPDDYISVTASFHSPDHPAQTFSSAYPASAFSASPDHLDVRIGPHAARSTPAGVIHLTLQSASLSADLTFSPRTAPIPFTRLLPVPAAHHAWTIARPACDVTGSLTAPALSPGPIPFHAHGYQTHAFGSAPLAPALRSLLHGSAAFPDRSFTFHVFHLRARETQPLVQLLESTGPSVVAHPNVPFHTHTTRRAGLFHTYPATLSLGDHLTLTHPHILHRTPHTLLLRYTATTPTGATAACVAGVCRPPSAGACR